MLNNAYYKLLYIVPDIIDIQNIIVICLNFNIKNVTGTAITT